MGIKGIGNVGAGVVKLLLIRGIEMSVGLIGWPGLSLDRHTGNLFSNLSNISTRLSTVVGRSIHIYVCMSSVSILVSLYNLSISLSYNIYEFLCLSAFGLAAL